MSQSNDDMTQAFEKLQASLDQLNETLVHGFAILSQEITGMRGDINAQDVRIEYLTDVVCDRLGVPKGNAKPGQPRPGVSS